MQTAPKRRVRGGGKTGSKRLSQLWPGESGGPRIVPTLTLSHAAPWVVTESPACRKLMGRLGNDESNLAAMVMQDPAGAAVLGAAGAQEDNDVAARAVVEIQKRAPRTGRRSVSQLDQTAGGSFSQRKRSCSKRQAAAQITMFDQPQHPQLTFGAVYEHRDSCGKPKLLGSTSVMPERQFAFSFLAFSFLVPKGSSHKQLRSRCTTSFIRILVPRFISFLHFLHGCNIFVLQYSVCGPKINSFLNKRDF